MQSKRNILVICTWRCFDERIICLKPVKFFKKGNLFDKFCIFFLMFGFLFFLICVFNFNLILSALFSTLLLLSNIFIFLFSFSVQFISKSIILHLSCRCSHLQCQSRCWTCLYLSFSFSLFFIFLLNLGFLVLSYLQCCLLKSTLSLSDAISLFSVFFLILFRILLT